jgi:hypothetical protein
MNDNDAASCFGIASLSTGFYDLDGMWRTAAYGFLRVVTDKEWGPNFHSTERWQLLVSADEKSEAVLIIPGCSVKGIVVGKTDGAGFKNKPDIFNATRQNRCENE